MITIRFVDDCDAIAADLWQECFPSPHEGLFWYRTLQHSGLEAQFRFTYGVVELTEGGVTRDVGIAPMFSAAVPLELVLPPLAMRVLRPLGRWLPSLLVQRTLFIGSPCSDTGWVGLMAGVPVRVALAAVQEAAQHLARRWKLPMVVWKDTPPERAADMSWLRDQYALVALPGYPNALLRFAGPTKADYFAALKGSRRHQLKKKLRLGAERAPLDVRVVQAPPPALMDRLYALFQQTFDRSDIQFERLNRRFFDLIAAQPNVHFLMLVHPEHGPDGGQVVAFMLIFVIGDLVINKFIGFDYSCPKEWLLYFRLFDAAIDWSLERGARALQSGQTCYAPKIEQGHDLVPLSIHGRHANPLVRFIYAKVAPTITWASLDEDLARHLAAHPESQPPHPGQILS